uniref:Uncharacterized protein n=1 Tax=Nelumbo nucifera TaxID=4432 RepID=A0A822ZIR7_NELNU|nr:TPA_asm: hypothetical protein HUJ06_001595 [Nelumbo nucifera]
MEKRFKVYVYKDGDPPLFHDGPCKNTYTIEEGRFIQEMEFGMNGFRTRDAQHAHVFFLPFSVTKMVAYIYQPLSYDLSPLQWFVSGYLRSISSNYLAGTELKELITSCFLAMIG